MLGGSGAERPPGLARTPSRPFRAPLAGLLAALAVAAPPVFAQTAPVFTETAPVSRSVDENTGPGENVGAAVTATDADGDPLTYSLGGTDAASFDIETSSGQIKTEEGVSYDHETTPSYSVAVSVADDENHTATIAVTILVGDRLESPSAMETLTAFSLPSSHTTLYLGWPRPHNTGPPLNYHVEVRPESNQEHFTQVRSRRFPPAGTTYNHLLRLGLIDRTAHDVRVRAQSAEGHTAWLELEVRTGNPPTVVPPDWGLIPDGLEAGDRFRLLFATSTTRQANDGDIDDYNDFVQERAAAGHAAIQDYSELFAVVGSTADTDARDNTATNYIELDKGPPIYWLNGSKVADNYEDFYDGTWDDEDGAKDESGSDRSLSLASDRPYTGSNNDGTGLASNTLGASGNQVGIGHPGDDGNAGPLAGGGTSDGNIARPVYALSPVFEVGQEVEVGANWGLVPSGLTAGDKFRLLFIAEDLGDAVNKTEPESNTIAEFNKLVQDEAAAGHAAIQDYSKQFTVVGSVEEQEEWFPSGAEETLLPTLEEILNAEIAHARDNTKTTYTSASDKGVPIYWMNGSKVADDYEDFYDWGWDDEANPRNRSGELTTERLVQTGSDHDGVLNPLFMDGQLSIGIARAESGLLNDSQSGIGPLSGVAPGAPGFEGLREDSLYALSPVFVVSSEVSTNSAPTFPNATETRSVAENTAAGENVGTPVAASDPDTGDTLTYALGGADAGSFDIDMTSGQIKVKEALDYEVKETHSVTVSVADSGHGGSATVPVTITVTDVDEQPETPRAPTVIDGTSTTSLDVGWSVPELNGGPLIIGYKFRHRKVGSQGWTETSTPISDVFTGPYRRTIRSLDPHTAYEVQVQALNGETPSLWSPSGIGSTANTRPVFSDTAPVTRSVAENTDAGENVGAPVAATDADTGDTLTYTLTGDGVTVFDIVSTSGQIRTKAALDYETKSSYTVLLNVTDDSGFPDRSADIGVTIMVTDVDEPLDPPAAPTVVAIPDTTDSLMVSWTAPVDISPAITDYDVRHQEVGSGSWTELDHVGTGLSATVTGLAAGTTYAAQVRATNADGTSAWSRSGMGRTNALPTEVPSNWSLAPSGLAAGEPFRLLFVSSGTRDATSTDIGDYNTFVQNAAAAGHTDIQAYSAGFRAVASTADVDASVNTKTLYTDDDKGPPIYWLGGAKLADDYEDLYDGKWDEEETGRDEAGDSVTYGTYDFSDNRVWTGSGQDGTESRGSDNSSEALGTDTPETGLLNFPFITVYGPLFGDSEAKASLNPLYGLSEVFQIAAAAAMNSAPVFANAAEARSVAENTAAGENVGAVVTATDANGDTLEYSLEGTDAASFDIDSTSGQIQTKSGVTYDHEAKSSYSVTVKADDGNGGSDTVPVTITVTDVNEQPATPTAPSVTATENTTDSLDASWTAPGLNGGPALTGYEVQYRKGTGGSWSAWTHSGTGTSATITPLDASSDYQVQVRALNGETPSDWSPAGTGTTGTPNSAPVFANAAEARSVAENTAAGENVGAVVTATDANGDTLEYSLEGTDAASFDIDSTSGQIQTKSGVTYDHEAKSSYSVTVKADDGNGGSDTVPVTITVTDVNEQPATPTAPSVTATENTTDSLDVSWTAPGLNGGPALTGYEVQYRKGTGGSWSAWTGTVTGTSATITPLDASSDYQVQVRALNGETTSPWSLPGSGQTGTLGAPDVPHSFDATPGNRQVMLSWVLPSGGAEVTHYEYEQDGSGTWISTGSTAPSYTVRNLTNGQSYTFRVRAANSAGASAASTASASVTPATVPGAPTGLSATVSDQRVDLIWTAPSSNGGQSITDYEYEQGGSGTWISTGSTATSYMVRNLTNGQPYRFRVRAVNSVGAGAASAASPNVTPATEPDAPTGLSATVSDQEVDLIWTAPASNGGATILRYEYELDFSGTWTSTGGTATSYTVTGLTNGQTYTFRVRAVNRVGAGLATSSRSATPTSTVVAPDTPSDLSATPGNRQVMLSWVLPSGGAALTHYEYEQDGSGTWTSTGGKAPSDQTDFLYQP